MEEGGILKSRIEPVPVPDQAFYNLLKTNAEDIPDEIAIFDLNTGRTLTYGELLQHVEVAARHLVRLGFKTRDTMVFYSYNCPEFIAMTYAVLRLEGIFAGVHNLLTAVDLKNQIELCEGSFLFTSEDLVANALEATTGTNQTIICREDFNECIGFNSLLESNADLPELPPWAPTKNILDEASFICFSSGTTGLPKAVMLSQRGLIATFHIAKLSGMLDAKLIIFAPFGNLGGLSPALFLISARAQLVIMKQFDLSIFLKAIVDLLISVVIIAPPIAVLLVKHPLVERYDLSCVKTVICASAPLSAELEEQLRARLKGNYIQMIQMYAMTETSGSVAQSLPDHYRPSHIPPCPPGTCGLLAPGVEAKVIDITTAAPLGPDTDGEFLIRGPGVMLGYMKNPDATIQAINADGWFHTGDIGHYNKDGYFFIVDRLKEIIKCRTWQVPPSELEAIILSIGAVADCGVPHEEDGEVPHAWVVRKPGADITEEYIVKFVEERVSPFKQLKGGVKFVDNIPKSPTGKILRRLIKEMACKE